MFRDQNEQMKQALVILVDDQDNEIGVLNKYEAHRTVPGPKLHRAFSLFLFNSKGELLLQQRSKDKLTFPLIWANTCCSHPEPGEDVIEGAIRRTQFELGISLTEANSLKKVGIFKYLAENGEWAEYEVDHVIYGKYDGPVDSFLPEEVNAVRWVSKENLAQWISQDASNLSPWFLKIWAKWLQFNWGLESLQGKQAETEVLNL